MEVEAAIDLVTKRIDELKCDLLMGRHTTPQREMYNLIYQNEKMLAALYRFEEGYPIIFVKILEPLFTPILLISPEKPEA